MLCIQEELEQLGGIAGGPIISAPHGSQLPDSSHTHSESISNSSEAASKCNAGSGTLDALSQKSWVENFFGCMRPVWTMISKAVPNEKIKGQSESTIFNLQISMLKFPS